MKHLPIIALIGLIPFFGYGQIVSNGGFEGGIQTGWSHLEGNASVRFMEDSYNVREGSKSLRVKVESVTPGNYPRSVNRTFTNTGKDTYLLRFWAISDSDKDLYVSISGQEDDLVHYRIRDKWRLYHLPFDTGSENLDIRFVYPEEGFYVIDGIEVLDQNSGFIDVEQTFKWNERYAEGWGWIAGDNDISLELPDGRMVYFFNDSFYGYNDPSDNEFQSDGSRFLRNAMVVEENDGLLYSRYSGSQENTTRYFESIDPSPQPGVDNFYWVGDATMYDDHVLVYLVELLNTAGGATATERSYIASLSYPELELEGIFRQEDLAYSYESFFAEGDYFYLYRTQSEGVWTASTRMARCHRDDLLGHQGSWRFYDGMEWVEDPDATTAVNDERAESFARLQEGNYVQISMPVLSNEIKASFAPSPVGPWTEAEVIYYIPSDEEYWWYLPNLQHQLPNGKFQISYSVNSWEGWGDAWKDKYWYRQRYIQVDLLDLSPYTDQERDNLATDHPVTSSMSGASAAVDGDLSTAWQVDSPGPNEWFYVDLGSTKDISEVKLLWGDRVPLRFQIGSSMDGSDWTLHKTVKENSYSFNDLCALRMVGRYIGVRVLDAPEGMDLREFGVYGVDHIAIPLNATQRSTVVNSSVKPHPIPFDTYLDISLDGFGTDGSVDILLYDLHGKRLRADRVSLSDQPLHRLEMGGAFGQTLPAGAYILQLKGLTHQEVHRILKR